MALPGWYDPVRDKLSPEEQSQYNSMTPYEQMRWRATGKPATRRMATQYGGHVAGPGDAILDRANASIERNKAAQSTPYAALAQAGSSNPALERDLGVEKLRRARIENELLDAQSPMSQDAAIQTGRAGRAADFASEKGASAAQALARGQALGAQTGIDEALLSPLRAHAEAVRHGRAKELAYGRGAASVDAALIRAEAEALKEQIRQAGLLRTQEAKGLSAEEQALIRAYGMLADQSNLYTDEQRQAAAQALTDMLAKFRSGR